MDPSPLTRGKLTLTHSLPLLHWLIPAHAGKTNSAGLYPISLPAHPRSRGENLAGRRSGRLQLGSSPLTRGKQVVEREGECHRGLIPAHAGKTSSVDSSRACILAHPRSRRENGIWERVNESAGGSSPLTRGKRKHRVEHRLHGGLIPAHAGKTCRGGRAPSRHPAHPRSHGENALIASRARRRAGSSPLTRGKPSPFAQLGGQVGLIPAHAGKTASTAGPGHP